MRLIGLALAMLVLMLAPLGADGEQAGKVYRIGYLSPTSREPSLPGLDGFRQGLRELGWFEGQNVAIEYRWADGKLDRLPALAADLVRTPLDVIVVGGNAAAWATLEATPTVPIVGAALGDPVIVGLAMSLARPGGRVTGLALQTGDLVTKELQLLKETVPKAARVAILAQHTTTSLNPHVQKAAEAAARALGLKGRVFEIRDVPDFDSAFRAEKAEQAFAMHVLPSPMFFRHRTRLAELAVKHRLPGMYETKVDVEAGGLMSYGPSYPDMYRRAASYVDHILKRAKPGDLPIEQPNKHELAINLKTAKALGVIIPQSFLLRADQIIE